MLLSSLLSVLPTLLALGTTPAAAVPTSTQPQLQGRSRGNAARANAIGEHLPRVYKRAAAPQSPAIASRQYNPRTARPKRPHRRALQSDVPAPETVTSVYGGHEYKRFYEGSGFIETDANPSNPEDIQDDYPPRQTTYPGTTTTTLAALQQCVEFADNPDYYWGLQLYFLGSQDQWVCRTYYHFSADSRDNSDPSYFNIPNNDVVVAYGYQHFS